MSSDRLARLHTTSSVSLPDLRLARRLGAGPDQSVTNPLGVGGRRLHEWAFATVGLRAQPVAQGGEHTRDAEVVDQAVSGVGAHVMGRNMFGGGTGDRGTSRGAAGGARTRRSATRCSCSHHPRSARAARRVGQARDGCRTFVTRGLRRAALEPVTPSARGRGHGQDVRSPAADTVRRGASPAAATRIRSSTCYNRSRIVARRHGAADQFDDARRRRCSSRSRSSARRP